MKNQRISVLITAALLAFLFGGRAVVLITDWMWFDAVGYGSVFTTVFTAQLGIGIAVGLVTFALLFGSAFVALRDRAPSAELLTGEFAESPLGQVLKDASFVRLASIGAVVVSAVFGAGSTAWWDDALLLLNGSDFGYVDPLLGLDAGFYVFTLPLLQNVQGLLTLLLMLSLGLSAGLYLMLADIRVEIEEIKGQVYFKGFHIADRARTHLGVLGGATLMSFGAGAVLGRYAALYGQASLMAGPGFAVANYRMNLLLLQAAVAVAAGIAVFIGSRQRQPFIVWGGVGSYVLASLLTSFVPDLVQRFQVRPTEFALESPYIEHHIKATRWAYQLDHVVSRSLDGKAQLTRQQIDDNRPTIDNVRLWDHLPLLKTFSSEQELRTFYHFESVDNDRYMIDGELRQIMMSPREIDVRGLEQRAQNWVSTTMQYTHGYGVALGPVNEVTKAGLPQLFIKDLPPVSTFPEDLNIERPALYYGESMRNEVLVKTVTPDLELDYQQGYDEIYTTYSGVGGVGVGSLMRQALFAARLEDVNLLLSQDVGPETRLLMHRDIVERAHAIAPFLLLDDDPYLVITDEGKLVWIIDAYTVTGRFPYSRASGHSGLRNYQRNSVKLTVDAYDGSLEFYDMEVGDPILTAWKQVFPELFRSKAEMPEWMVFHLRYPQDFFRLQTDLYATYHVEDAQVYFSGSDDWRVPVVSESRMKPFYTIMKLPRLEQERDEEFIVMLPFNTASQEVLASWLVGRSDGEHYGELNAYVFPKDARVWGPGQIDRRINQDPDISEKLTLWNQGGSTARLGTMLVIPIEESLIYIQPLYLAADSNPLPELKRVVVGYGEDKIAMGNTLDEALDKLFAALGADAPVMPVSTPPEPGDPTAPVEPADEPVLPPDGSGTLAEQASAHYAAAIAAQRAGDWATYGAELDKLGAAIEEMKTASQTP